MTDLSLNLFLTDGVRLAFLLALGIYAIFSAILYYHWNSYSTDNTVTKITYVTYLITTTPLLMTMLAVAYLIM